MEYRIERYDGNLLFALDSETQERIKIKNRKEATDFISNNDSITTEEAEGRLDEGLKGKSPKYTSKPLMLTWQITGNCNCNCSNCGNNSGVSRPEYDMNQCDEIIQDIGSLDLLKITLTGGEPTLSSILGHILDGISFVPRIGITTNGSTLTREGVKKLRQKNVRAVKLSLDGLESFHDTYRGVRGLFGKNIALIENLRDYGIEARVQSTLMHGNRDEMIPLMHFLDGKVSQISFVPLLNIGRASQQDMLNPLEYQELVKQIVQESHKLGGKTKIHVRPVFDLPLDQMDLEKGILNTKYRCEGLRTTMEISYTGDVIPCSFLHYPIGNISSERLVDIWGGERANSARNLFDSTEKCESCSSCDSYKECGGGCIANGHIEGKRIVSPDRYCWREK